MPLRKKKKKVTKLALMGMSNFSSHPIRDFVIKRRINLLFSPLFVYCFSSSLLVACHLSLQFFLHLTMLFSRTPSRLWFSLAVRGHFFMVCCWDPPFLLWRAPIIRVHDHWSAFLFFSPWRIEQKTDVIYLFQQKIYKILMPFIHLSKKYTYIYI